MTQHTQGPWEARWSERGGYWFIDHEQGGEGYTLTKLDCKESDANLIAAAPDLLAALQAIVTGNVYGNPTQWNLAIDRGIAALAKATGGAA